MAEWLREERVGQGQEDAGCGPGLQSRRWDARESSLWNSHLPFREPMVSMTFTATGCPNLCSVLPNIGPNTPCSSLYNSLHRAGANYILAPILTVASSPVRHGAETSGDDIDRQ